MFRSVTLVAALLATTAFAHTKLEPPDVAGELAALAPELQALVTAQVPTSAPAPTPVVETPAPASSTIGTFLSQFLTPTGIASLVLTVLGLIAGATSLSALRKRQIAIVTQAAFHGVEDFAATTETTVDDKIAAGLKIADDWMKAQGWRPLKPDEQEVVKLGFSALNGATKVAEKVSVAAAEAAKPAVPPTAG